MNKKPDPMEERYLAQIRNRRNLTIIGIAAMALGYALLAISPDTEQHWVLLRVAVGFSCIMLGFVMAVIPLLGSLFGSEE